MSSRKPTVIVAVLMCGALLAGISRPTEPSQTPIDGGRRAFDAAVTRYVNLRTALEDPLPSFEDPRRDPWTLVLMRRYLAAALRSARRGAEMGCIFGPAAGLFREAIALPINQGDVDGVADEEGDAEDFVVDLALNEPVPEWAMSPVARPLLDRLPAVPVAVEYRRAGTALILWDTRAEILVDALPNAFAGY